MGLDPILDERLTSILEMSHNFWQAYGKMVISHKIKIYGFDSNWNLKYTSRAFEQYKEPANRSPNGVRASL